VLKHNKKYAVTDEFIDEEKVEYMFVTEGDLQTGVQTDNGIDSLSDTETDSQTETETDSHRLAWAPMISGNCLACPCIETALYI
jgi:hypothetical protein